MILKLPEDGRILGFDNGDLTGNGEEDIVLAFDTPKNNRREIDILFFAARNDEYSLIQSLVRSYEELPIEVAFYIENGAIYLTSKHKERHWKIEGYTLKIFVFRRISLWEHFQVPNTRYGYKQEIDLKTYQARDEYYLIRDRSLAMERSFALLPVVHSSLQVPDRYAYVVGDSTGKFIADGYGNWSGADDCSIYFRGVHDSSALTISTLIYDDWMLDSETDSLTDELALYLDLDTDHTWHWYDGGYSARIKSERGKLKVGLQISGGSAPSRVSISCSEMDDEQFERLEGIQAAILEIRPQVYRVTVRLPMAIVGKVKKQQRLGFVLTYVDRDDPLHPERFTKFSSKLRFDPDRAYTYGILELYPDGEDILQQEDLRVNTMLKELTNPGLHGNAESGGSGRGK